MKITGQYNLSVVNPRLAQEWHPTKNGNLTPEDITPKFHKKFWWQCKRGHDWEARLDHRSNGVGCPYCCGKRACKENCLATVNPHLAKEWHPSKNGELTPQNVTPGSNKNVWWQCKEGHEYKSSVNHRSDGNGCPYCSGRKVCKKKCLATVNPHLAKEWHPTKNGKQTPENVISGSHQKVWWLCKKGHEWKAVVKSRSAGRGCPYCSSTKVCKDNCLSAKNPQLAKEWHPTKNGKLTPEYVMPWSNKKVWWRCDKGHEYTSTVNYKSKGGGCPCCSRRKVCEDNCLSTVNPKLAQEWHPSKNGNLTPKDVMPMSHKKVWWQCRRGHDWETPVRNRSTGRGCVYCNTSTSAMELKIYSELKYIFPDARLREKINKVECDIYIPSLKVGVEYDGVYWHRNKHKKDVSKSKVLENNGIKLIRVREIGLDRVAKSDVLYDYTKKKYKQLVDSLLKRIEEVSVFSDVDQARVSQYFRETELANNQEFINLLDMLPSPFPGTSLADLNPKLAADWHFSKNGKLRPEDVTPQSNKDVWWRCGKGHEWKSIVGNRSKGQGCPYCSGRRAFGDNCLAKANLQLAKEWHLSKNGKLTPEDVTHKSNRKAWWLCDKGHEWEAVISSRSKSGCPYCSGNRVTKETCLAAKNPLLANEWHPIKNGKLRPEDVTSGCSKKVWWQCDKDHEWEAVVSSRSAGCGCPYCAGRKSNSTQLALL